VFLDHDTLSPTAKILCKIPMQLMVQKCVLSSEQLIPTFAGGIMILSYDSSLEGQKKLDCSMLNCSVARSDNGYIDNKFVLRMWSRMMRIKFQIKCEKICERAQ
jgi:hypothetical protein